MSGANDFGRVQGNGRHHVDHFTICADTLFQPPVVGHVNSLVEDAAAGMQEKSEEFLAKGSEIYHKAV